MDTVYEGWLQTDLRLNQTEAWTAARFPDATYRYFRECGCLVCALAVMLRHHRIETTEDEVLFNPWVLNSRLIECGAFDSEADLELSYISRLYPIQYLGSTPYSWDALAEAAKEGRPCLVAVPGVNTSRHFLALLGVTQDDATVFDPLFGVRSLNSYSQVLEIRSFRQMAPSKNGMTNMTMLPCSH